MSERARPVIAVKPCAIRSLSPRSDVAGRRLSLLSDATPDHRGLLSRATGIFPLADRHTVDSRVAAGKGRRRRWSDSSHGIAASTSQTLTHCLRHDVSKIVAARSMPWINRLSMDSNLTCLAIRDRGVCAGKFALSGTGGTNCLAATRPFGIIPRVVRISVRSNICPPPPRLPSAYPQSNDERPLPASVRKTRTLEVLHA